MYGYRLEDILIAVDTLLDTKRKRHVVGGVLISVSFLFGGLALTVFTIKEDERSSYEQSTN